MNDTSKSTGRTILVTGGCGYIGSHVARNLSEQGDKVIVLDNLSTGFKDALLHGEKLIQADCGNTEVLEKIFKEHRIDAIMHFAAAIRVEESVAKPAMYYLNNTVNTLKLVDAASKAGIKYFIFSSTAATYGQPKHVPVEETDPTSPESPYGASKLMSERMLMDIAAATSMKYVILRYFNVAGADPTGRIGQRSPEATHLIKVACEVAVGKRSSMSIYGTDYPTSDGTCVRDYIHVEDLASAHIQALAYLIQGGASTLANCGYGKGSTVREVIAAVQKVSGNKFPVAEAPRRPGDVAEIVAKSEKAQSLFKWKPRFADLYTIVKHAYQWEVELKKRG